MASTAARTLRAFIADHHHRLAAAARFRVRQGVSDERGAADVHQRFGHADLGATQPRAEPCGENDRLMSVRAHQSDCMPSERRVFFIMVT